MKRIRELEGHWLFHELDVAWQALGMASEWSVKMTNSKSMLGVAKCYHQSMVFINAAWDVMRKLPDAEHNHIVKTLNWTRYDAKWWCIRCIESLENSLVDLDMKLNQTPI